MTGGKWGFFALNCLIPPAAACLSASPFDNTKGDARCRASPVIQPRSVLKPIELYTICRWRIGCVVSSFNSDGKAGTCPASAQVGGLLEREAGGCNRPGHANLISSPRLNHQNRRCDDDWWNLQALNADG